MATSGEEGLHKRSTLAKNRLKFCDLPDEILIRIISLLPTTDGVATSILSRRWRYLCMSITKLEFSEEDSFIREERRRRQFMNFIDSVMTHDRSSLASLSLSWRVIGDVFRVDRWITSAIRCNIKDLSLQFDNCPSSYRLPLCVFSSESLVKLKLKVDYCILTVPSSIRLPNVKYLELDFVNFDNDESAEKLLSIPSLEELHIKGRSWGAIKSLSVTFPKLRVLKVHDEGRGNSEPDKDIDCKIMFSGDSLEYFSFTGFPSGDYYICSSAVQLKAEILVQYFRSRQVNMDITAERCYKLLSGLSRVCNLTLTEDFVQILEKATELVGTLPVFEYLVQLNLQAYFTTGVRIDSLMIMNIYERCPHLEHLNFMHAPLSNDVRGTILQPMPSCFLTHLKRITIVDYKPEEQGNALQALLNSAPILEEMIVVYRRPSTLCAEHLLSEIQIQNFEDEINNRPRASNDCRISVVLYRC